MNAYYLILVAKETFYKIEHIISLGKITIINSILSEVKVMFVFSFFKRHSTFKLEISFVVRPLNLLMTNVRIRNNNNYRCPEPNARPATPEKILFLTYI